MSYIAVSFDEFPDVIITNERFNEGFVLEDLTNWFDGTSVREQKETRPDSDGDFEQDPVFVDARYPVVTGNVFYAQEADLFAARRVVAALWSYQGPLTMRVVSPEGTRTATVVRNGKPTWDLNIAPDFAEFELPFKAADPRKYGALQSASTGLPVAGAGVLSPVTSPFSQVGGGNPGRVVLTNNGTTDTIPSFIISGGGLSGGVELTRIETAQKLRLEWPILATDVVRFSPGDGQVWLNDQSPIAGYLTISDWWTLGPGETATVQFEGLGAVTGTPMLTAEWRDADS